MIVCHLFNGLSHQINKIGDVVRVVPPIHSHALIGGNITFVKDNHQLIQSLSSQDNHQPAQQKQNLSIPTTQDHSKN